MKKYIFSMAGLLFCLLSNAQQSGAIYYFNFRVVEQLTENTKVEDNSKSFLSGVSVQDEMPQQLLDSIKKKAEDAFSKKLALPVKLCYRKNKAGEEIGSTSIGGMIAGLPDNTFNRGKEECPANNRYISLTVDIYPSGGVSIVLGGTKK